MDRPVTMPLKNWLIRRMSVDMMVQEPIIEAVVNHQFESALSAIEEHGKESLEFSGFCKFLFNRKKAIKKLEKYRSQKEMFARQAEETESKQRKGSLEYKAMMAGKNYERLKYKLYGREDGRIEENPS
jgi:hypothetical protein